MTFIVKRGSFAKTTAGAPVSQTVDTLSGEEIKFIRFWTEKQVGVGFLDGNLGHSEGWSDGTNEGSVAIAVADNVADADAARRQAAVALTAINPNQSLAYQGTITSFGSGVDAGKFTINWTTNDIDADEIYYEAFCGNKIKNVKIGTFTSATSTGNQSITGVGFQPNYLNVWSIGRSNALPTTVADASYSIGDAVSASKRNGIAMYVDEGAVNTITTQTDLLIRTLEFLGMGGGATVKEDIDFVSFGADGWTHNMIKADADADIFGYLAVEFEDVEVDIGDFLQETTNTTVNVATSNENVQSIKLRSQMRTATSSIINDGIVKQMVASGVYNNGTISQAVTGYFYDDNGGTSDNEKFGDKTKVAKMVSSQTTVDGEAELVAQTVLSDFRLTWTNTDGTARELLYTAFSFDLQGHDWTNDAIVVDRFDNEFDVDALLSQTQTNAFDCDAILIATFEDESDVDAIVVDRNPHTFSLDAYLQTTNTDAITCDAILVNRNTDASTVDAILLLQSDLGFTVDANVQLSTSQNYTVDAFLKKLDREFTWTNDAILLALFSTTWTNDAIPVDRNPKTFKVDAIRVNRKPKNSLVDAIISSRLTETITVDGNVALISDDESLVDAFLLKETNHNFTTDAITKAGFSVVYTADALLRKLDKESTFTVDSYLEEIRQIVLTNDAILSSRLVEEFTLDTFLRKKGILVEFTIDALLPTTVDLDFTIDARLIMIESTDYTLDSILRKSNITTFTADAILSGLLRFDVDALIRTKKNLSFTVDAIRSSRKPKTFLVDANIESGTNTLPFTVDANIEGADTLLFTVDANIIGLTSLPWTCDAIIVERKTFDYTIDAFLRGPIEFTFEADAIITADGFFFYTIDAEIEGKLNHNFTVDALLPAVTNLPFNLDAVVVSQPTFDFNLDAILGGPGLFFWSVDGIIFLDQSCAFPDSDISNAGLWTPTPLWKKINTLQCDDVNFVNRNGHPDPADSFEVGLEPLGDPNVSTNHTITISGRTDKPNDHFQVRGTLKQDGVTVIAKTPYFVLTSDFQNFVYMLTTAEADAITNYMTLSTLLETETAKNNITGFTGDAILV